MICEKELRHELSRYPFLINKAWKEGDLETVTELMYNERCIEWILNDICECKEVKLCRGSKKKKGKN